MDFTEQKQVAPDQIGGHWYYRAKFSLLQAALRQVNAFGPSRRLADIGCGLGVFLTLLEEARLMEARQMVGIDPAAQMGQQSVGGATPLVTTWPDDQFDIILMMDVLEHIEDDGAALQNAWSHLKPGGYLFITVPAFMFLWSNHDKVLGHYRRYTLNSLRKLIGSIPEGRIERLHYFYFSIFPLVTAIRWIRRGKQEGASDLKPVPAWLNSILTAVLSLEARLAKYNKWAGVSVVALVRKPATSPSGSV